MKRMILIHTFALIFVQLTSAQCPQYDLAPPKLRNVVVKGVAARNANSTMFTYSYSLSNGATSTGCINGIDIDISMPRNSLEMSNAGLTDYPRYIDRSPLRFDTTVHVVAVGIPTLPSMNGLTSVWFVNFTLDGTVGWFRSIPEYRLQPGSEVQGLIITSHGLPTIRRFVVTPSYNPKPRTEITPKNEDSLYLNAPRTTEEEDSAQTAVLESIRVRGWTIGPTALPVDFDAPVWLDTLISYKHQALALGWIDNQGVANSLDQKLDNAKSQLQKGDTTAAKNTLRALVNEVEAQNGKHLTSEAFALLKYNAEYLISKLQ